MLYFLFTDLVCSPSIEASIASRPSIDDAFDVAMNLIASQKAVSSPKRGKSNFTSRGQSSSPPPQHAKNIRDPLMHNGGASAAGARSRGSSVFSASDGVKSGLSTTSDDDMHFNQRDPMIPFSGPLTFSSDDGDKMGVGAADTPSNVSSVNGENCRRNGRRTSLMRFSPSIGPQDIPTLDMSQLSPHSTPRNAASRSRATSNCNKSESLVFEVPTPKPLRKRNNNPFSSTNNPMNSDDIERELDALIKNEVEVGVSTPSGAMEASTTRARGRNRHRGGEPDDVRRARSPAPPPSLAGIFTSSPEVLLEVGASSPLLESCGDELDHAGRVGEPDHQDVEFGGQFHGFGASSGAFATDSCMSPTNDVFGVSSSAAGTSTTFQSSSRLTSELPTPTLRPSPFISPLCAASFLGESSAATSNTTFTPLPPATVAPFDSSNALQSAVGSCSIQQQPMSLLSAISSSCTSVGDVSSPAALAPHSHLVPPAPPISQLPLGKGSSKLSALLSPMPFPSVVGDMVLGGALGAHCAPPPPPPAVC